MLKILKFAKPYLGQIVLAALLLFLQANMDLALPDYMSRIVNIGIQQGGIEDAVPQYVRESSLERMVSMLSPEEAEWIKTYYRLDSTLTFQLDEPVLILTAMEEEEKAALEQRLVAVIGQTVLEQMDSLKQAIADPSYEMLKGMTINVLKQEYNALGISEEELQRDYILRTGALMLLLTLISVAATVLVGLLASRTAAGTARNIRGDLFERVSLFSGEEFDRFSTASLITRNTNDVTQIQTVIFMVIRMVIYAPIMGIGGVIRALGKAPSMAWIIGLAVLILLGVIMVVFAIALPKFKSIQKLVDRVNLVAREQLTGLLVVRAFNRQQFEENRFEKANTDLTAINLFVSRVMVVVMPVIMLIMNLLTLTIIWVGAQHIAEASMQVGDMIAFLQYAMQIMMSFLMLSMVLIFLPRASVSGVRIAEVLDTEISITDKPDPEKIPSGQQATIEFRNVSFRYPGAEEDVLHDINFTAKPGMTTAIIGATGSGKSTLVSLIPRLYDIRTGEILINGKDLRDVSQRDLRSYIGYVPQKSVLFSGTIEDNVAFGQDSSKENEILEALEVAQATEFVNDKSEGIGSSISQGGSNLSGGQKQRLSIARALYRDYPLYVFDDSFSALDFKTDAKLRQALKQRAKDSAFIIVAQRVSTIMMADQILVLDEGKIIGRGTHDDLVVSCKPYREIVQSQLEYKEVGNE